MAPVPMAAPRGWPRAASQAPVPRPQRMAAMKAARVRRAGRSWAMRRWVGSASGVRGRGPRVAPRRQVPMRVARALAAA